MLPGQPLKKHLASGRFDDDLPSEFINSVGKCLMSDAGALRLHQYGQIKRLLEGQFFQLYANVRSPCRRVRVKDGRVAISQSGSNPIIKWKRFPLHHEVHFPIWYRLETTSEPDRFPARTA